MPNHATASVMVGQQLQVGEATRDATGNPLAAPVTWTSSDPAIATVGVTGVVHWSTVQCPCPSLAGSRLHI